jgi:hydroxylysine kinase
MATMVAGAQVPLARALAVVRDCYGIEARGERLSGERDENFRLSAADGAQYVLKITHAAEDAAVGELLSEVLQHLARVDPGLPCPRLVRLRDGACHAHFHDDSGVPRRARLLTYLEGQPLGTVTRSAQQRAACGRIAGRLSSALRSFEHPAAHRVLIWDLRQVGAVARLLEELASFPARHLAGELLRKIVSPIETRLPRLRHQVVHNDLNPLNILVQPSDPQRVTGIIDFGDLTHTALIGDVAVTAAELLPEQCVAGDGSARQAIREVVAAYHGSVPLLTEELALLHILVAARLVTNLVVQHWHVQRNPGGAHYAALNPAWVRSRLAVAAELVQENHR